jgi:hypothetical protein
VWGSLNRGAPRRMTASGRGMARAAAALLLGLRSRWPIPRRWIGPEQAPRGSESREGYRKTRAVTMVLADRGLRPRSSTFTRELET